MKEPLDTQSLHAFVDGELALEQHVEWEARIDQDPQARHAVGSVLALRDSLRARADYHTAPAELRSRLEGLIVPAVTRAGLPTEAQRRRTGPAWWTSFALSFALAGLLAWGVNLALLPAQREERLMAAVISTHVRAGLTQRLVDVASSDQHVVKPWLSSRLDFSPPVHDLAIPGLVFLGGRVEYLDGRMVAVLVYRQRQHLIDVFVWPADHGEQALSFGSQRGFNVAHRSAGGMTQWVVSDLGEAELAGVARALRDADATH